MRRRSFAVIKSDAEECYDASRQNYHRFKSLLTCDVGKLYVRLAKVRCKLQAGVYHGNQTMYEGAVQEEEGLLKDILTAVKADGSCVKFERKPGETGKIKSGHELTMYFHRSFDVHTPMDEEEIAQNVRFAELWYQFERVHNQEVAYGLTGPGSNRRRTRRRARRTAPRRLAFSCSHAPLALL